MKKPITPPETLERLMALIKQHGSYAKLAKFLGTNGPVIQMWVRRKSIPLGWQLVLAKMKLKPKEQA